MDDSLSTASGSTRTSVNTGKATSSMACGGVGGNNNIQVFLRIKPCPSDERLCLEQTTESEVRFAGHSGQPEQRFQYDSIGGPSCPQSAVWDAVALSMTQQYLSGYNATIFAYGQTGSGKTYTMQGSSEPPSCADHTGLIPRTIQYLFSQLDSHGDKLWNENVVKVTFVEIYNEAVYDLLVADGLADCTRMLREDVKRGVVYVEGVREETVANAEQAIAAFKRGAQCRHVAETRMNRESSRSHSIFTVHLMRKRHTGEGLEEVLESRFNLVDLAGSERQHSTGTVGVRLKEAGNINKSLLALSNVINALSDLNAASAPVGTKNPHVHYRDSKLTFLLRDSLGGNSRTAIIACVSPAWSCQGETLSTLRFAKRAKMIKNQAVINQDMRGSVQDLQAEIRRLQSLLSAVGPSTIAEGMPDATNGVAFLLRRLRAAVEETRLASLKCEQLEELSKRREQQLNSERLIVKFRDNALNNLKAGLPIDIKEAMEEIEALRKQLEDPSADQLRLQVENTELRRQIVHMSHEDNLDDEREAYVRRLEGELLAECPGNHDAVDKQVATCNDGCDTNELFKTIDQLSRDLANSQEFIQVLRAQHLQQLDSFKSQHAAELQSLEQVISKLQFQLANAQTDNEHLLHQLDSATHDSTASLQTRIGELVAENAKLRHENDKLVQHHNTKQKLQYHVKIKQENNELKAALAAAREQLTSMNSSNSNGGLSGGRSPAFHK